jgi:hypothetical protein
MDVEAALRGIKPAFSRDANVFSAVAASQTRSREHKSPDLSGATPLVSLATHTGCPQARNGRHERADCPGGDFVAALFVTDLRFARRYGGDPRPPGCRPPTKPRLPNPVKAPMRTCAQIRSARQRRLDRSPPGASVGCLGADDRQCAAQPLRSLARDRCRHAIVTHVWAASYDMVEIVCTNGSAFAVQPPD